MKVVRIKTLLPVLKEIKRYILYEILSHGKMYSYQKIIQSELKGFIGDLGIARAGLNFITHKGSRGILQVNHRYVDEIKTGLALIDAFNIRTVKVSGTVRSVLDEL